MFNTCHVRSSVDIILNFDSEILYSANYDHELSKFSHLPLRPAVKAEE